MMAMKLDRSRREEGGKRVSAQTPELVGHQDSMLGLLTSKRIRQLRRRERSGRPIQQG